MSKTDVKTQDQIISELRTEVGVLNKSNDNLSDAIKELENRNERIIQRGIDVVEEKQALAMSPEIANQIAVMDFQLKMADNFIKSGAFPKSITAQQAFVIIQAGAEISLRPMEAMQTLYIHNGAVRAHSKGMVALLTRGGWKMDYTDEHKDGVTVTARKDDESYSFTVNIEGDTVLERLESSSKHNALKTDRRNKLRYHGVRQIINFYLPHSMSSIDINDPEDIEHAEIEAQDHKAENQTIKAIKLKVKSTKNPEDLNALYQNNVDLISGDIYLTKLFADIKEKFEQK